MTTMAAAIGNAEESAAIEANIKALEGLLDEFFRDVPNERKAEIERLLNEFGEQVSYYYWTKRMYNSKLISKV